MASHVSRMGAVSLLIAAASIACGGTSVTELSGPDGVRCQLSLASSAASVPASGSQLSVAVTAARDCAWNSHSDVSWMQVAPASGQGSASVTVSVAANASTTARTGAVAIETQTFQVTQAGAPAPPPPPPPTCTYTLNPPSVTVGASGGNRTVRVTTGSTCTWLATTTVPWITITSATTGSGTKDIDYKVDRNRTPSNRTGYVVVAGQLHTVVQNH